MNPRLAVLLLFLVLTAPVSRGRIIVDDTAPEPGPEINVPGPKGDGAADKGSGPQQDNLLFLNKDQLHGTLLGVDKGGLSWQSPEAEAVIQFKVANLAEVKLNSHPPATEKARNASG